MTTADVHLINRRQMHHMDVANPLPHTRDVHARNLRVLLNAHKMSERALSQASGVSQGQINNILNKRSTCSVETAEALACVFGLTGWHLLLHGLPDELIDSPRIGDMVESYLKMNGQGRELLDALIRRETTRKP